MIQFTLFITTIVYLFGGLLFGLWRLLKVQDEELYKTPKQIFGIMLLIVVSGPLLWVIVAGFLLYLFFDNLFKWLLK